MTMYTELEKLDRGEAAALRHLLDNNRRYGDADAIFYRIIPDGLSPYQEQCYRLVAGLYGYNRKKSAGDMGETLRQIRKSSESESDTLFTIIVNGTLAETEAGGEAGGTLPFHLRRAIMYAKSKEIGIDWDRLVADLIEWNNPDHRVQHRWMRNFYRE